MAESHFLFGASCPKRAPVSVTVRPVSGGFADDGDGLADGREEVDRAELVCDDVVQVRRSSSIA